MVRRDDSKPSEGRPTERAESRCACPAGESPARVVAGVPGSRPAPEAERPTGEAWGQKPPAGFDFLGCHLHMRMSGKLWEEKRLRRYYLQRWPSKRSMKRVRAKVKERTDRRTSGTRDVRVLIDGLNPLLRGWGNYFRTGNANQKFVQLDRYVVRRLNQRRKRIFGRHAKAGQRIAWTREAYEAKGLHRLRGTIRYPKRCMLPRESTPVSRVREIRTHGLKGGGGNRIA